MQEQFHLSAYVQLLRIHKVESGILRSRSKEGVYWCLTWKVARL